MTFFNDLFTRTWEELELAVACRRRHHHPKPPPGPVGPSAPLVTVRVLNHSSIVTDEQIAAAVVDLQTQVSHDFAPAWLIDALLVAGGTLQPDEWPLFIEDDATIQGALGFHEEMQGVPTGHVFAKTCQQYGVSWTSVASHELLEMLGDPRTVLAGIDDPNGDGKSGRIVMAEACDAVEQSTYHVGGTEVSDFVLPAWWDRASAGPFDHLDLVSEPFELEPGGSYIGLIEFTSKAGWQQQTAEKAPDAPQVTHSEEASGSSTAGSPAAMNINTSETTTS